MDGRGIVWKGMVCYGRRDMEVQGVLWRGVVGVERHCIDGDTWYEWSDMTWQGMVWHGVVSYGVVWYGVWCVGAVKNTMQQHLKTRHDTALFYSTVQGPVPQSPISLIVD